MKALAEMYEATTLTVDHVGHSENSKLRPKGSYAKIGNSDGMILCKRDGNRVTLTQTKNREADNEAYIASFERTEIDLGHDPDTGEPMSNLWFRAVEPAKVSPEGSTEKPSASMAYVANAIRILSGMSGLSIKRGTLAKEAVNASNPELCKTDPAKFEKACETFRKYLSRVREGHQLWPYVVQTTLNFGEPMDFHNPAHNGHRGKLPRRRRADIKLAVDHAAADNTAKEA
jgi:hypothetical protein